MKPDEAVTYRVSRVENLDPLSHERVGQEEEAESGGHEITALPEENGRQALVCPLSELKLKPSGAHPPLPAPYRPCQSQTAGTTTAGHVHEPRSELRQRPPSHVRRPDSWRSVLGSEASQNT